MSTFRYSPHLFKGGIVLLDPESGVHFQLVTCGTTDRRSDSNTLPKSILANQQVAPATHGGPLR
jgi:hypothetical protein